MFAQPQVELSMCSPWRRQPIGAGAGMPDQLASSTGAHVNDTLEIEDTQSSKRPLSIRVGTSARHEVPRRHRPTKGSRAVKDAADAMQTRRMERVGETTPPPCKRCKGVVLEPHRPLEAITYEVVDAHCHATVVSA